MILKRSWFIMSLCLVVSCSSMGESQTVKKDSSLVSSKNSIEEKAQKMLKGDSDRAIAAIGGSFSCVATEPFWGLRVFPRKMVFNSPDIKSKVFIVEKMLTAVGGPSDMAKVFKAENNSSLTVIKGNCSDGSSDEVYSHHAIFIMEDTALYGCCSL